jgi:hypothetical protein
MSYVAPTPADLKALYPAFSGVPEDTVVLWLARAQLRTDARWSDPERADAEIAYAAHKMAELGLAAGAIAAGVNSFKSGTFEAKVADTAANRIGLNSTVYGREFVSIRYRLFGGPRLAR